MPSCMVKCSVKTVPLINHCMVLHFHLAGAHSPNIYCKQKEDPGGEGRRQLSSNQTQDKTIDKTKAILTHHHEVDPTVATVVNDQPC